MRIECLLCIRLGETALCGQQQTTLSGVFCQCLDGADHWVYSGGRFDLCEWSRFTLHRGISNGEVIESDAFGEVRLDTAERQQSSRARRLLKLPGGRDVERNISRRAV